MIPFSNIPTLVRLHITDAILVVLRRPQPPLELRLARESLRSAAGHPSVAPRNVSRAVVARLPGNSRLEKSEM